MEISEVLEAFLENTQCEGGFRSTKDVNNIVYQTLWTSISKENR